MYDIVTTQELIEALEPIALEADQWHSRVADDREIATISDITDLDCIGERYMTVGDIRRIRALRERLIKMDERMKKMGDSK